ncbi:MAG: serine/threonine-protein kinase [Pseudomonadota bacterium]
MTTAWQQIETKFHELVALEPAERRVRLAELESTAPEVARELAKLLQAADLDDHSIVQLMDAGTTELLAQRSMVGKSLGPYTVLESLGQGGMGEVYKARRAQGDIEQTVAIKVLRASLVSEAARARFLAEQAILARLEHPYLARFIDHGFSEQGQPYLVMEYVDGVDIVSYCRDRNLSVQDRISLFLLVCNAVEHVHRGLVVHQDLKPGNILVSADGVPRLLDFGIARLGSIEDSLPVQGLTLAYASPEQLVLAAGDDLPCPEAPPTGMDKAEITDRSDQFSLATLLRELLAGDSTSVAASPREQLALLQNARFKSLSVPALGKRRCAELSAILARALAVEPSARYAAVHDFAQDLQAFLDNRPVNALSAGIPYRALKFVGRHRREFAILGVATLAITVMSLAYLSEYKRAAEALAAQEARANRVASFMVGVFSDVDPAKTRGDLDAVALLSAARDRARREFGDDPAVEVQVMGAIGRMLRQLGIYNEALEIHAEILNRHDSFLQSAPLAHAQALFDRAYIALETGKTRQAARLHSESLALRESLLDEPHPTIADSLRELGFVALMNDEKDKAERLLQRAAQMYLALGEEYLVPWTGTRMDQGAVLRREYRYAEAAEICREILSVQRDFHGDEHPLVAEAHHNLSVVYRELGRIGPARTHSRIALDLRTSLLRDEHPQILSTRVAMTTIELADGHWWRADAGARRILRELATTEFRWTDALYSRNVETLLLLGDLEAAREQLLAWENYLATSGVPSRRVATVEPLLAFAGADYGRSLALLQELESEFKTWFFSASATRAAFLNSPDARLLAELVDEAKLHVERHPHAVFAPWDQLYIAEGKRKLGQHRSSRSHLDKALKAADALWASDSVGQAIFALKVGWQMLALEDIEAGKEQLRRARDIWSTNVGTIPGNARLENLLADQIDALAARLD